MAPGTPGYVAVAIVNTILLFGAVFFIWKYAVKEIILDELKAYREERLVAAERAEREALIESLPPLPQVGFFDLEEEKKAA